MALPYSQYSLGDIKVSSLGDLLKQVHKKTKARFEVGKCTELAVVFNSLITQGIEAIFMNLKEDGSGLKPNTCDALTDRDINHLYAHKALGPYTPQSIISTWFVLA